MNIVTNSRCNKCRKILNISYFIDNPNGVGKICIDHEECKARQLQNNKGKENGK